VTVHSYFLGVMRLCDITFGINFVVNSTVLICVHCYRENDPTVVFLSRTDDFFEATLLILNFCYFYSRTEKNSSKLWAEDLVP
jgi:hypothetical protein